MAPLFETLTGESKALVWNEDLVDAFQERLWQTHMYSLSLSQNAQTSLATDASDSELGAVLQQIVNGVCVRLALFSRNLRPHKTRRSASDR